jgi:wyosine [tRNA(Phe)-imidazoG37] synthetase (radical SAM superfamily)
MDNYIFGPVPSRRLGRSLGVDLVPFKTCSYDCIYCQLGRTTCKTIERKEWVPLDAVLSELESKLSIQPDYITLSGLGEPTLYSRLDELIDRIKSMTDIPVAVLTNGSLLWQDEVQRQLAAADVVMPSLDTGDLTMFYLINRPHENLTFERMLSGLIAFRRKYHGHYWLEVLLVSGFTDCEPELAAICDCVKQIMPDRVFLNTVTRPPAENCARAVPQSRLVELVAGFSPPAEVLEDFHDSSMAQQSLASREDILRLLARRPCTISDIATGLRMHKIEVLKHVESLVADGLIEPRACGKEQVYMLAHESAKDVLPRV